MNKDLDNLDIMILSIILKFESVNLPSAKGTITPSIGDIEQELKKDNLQRCLNNLEEHGYVKCISENLGGRRYHITKKGEEMLSQLP